VDFWAAGFFGERGFYVNFTRRDFFGERGIDSGFWWKIRVLLKSEIMGGELGFYFKRL
jgi:hypothetical protein